MSRRANRRCKQKSQHKNEAESTGMLSILKSLANLLLISRRTKIASTLVIAVILLVSTLVLVVLPHMDKAPPNLGKNISSLPSSIGDFRKVSNSSSFIIGKVPVLYIGSEACPFCDAESWSIFNALKADGGTWASITYTYSNSTDTYPNTPGIDFAQASFSSSKIQFNGFEISDVNWKPLQSLNTTDNALFNKYDPNNYLPFILIGDQYVHMGGSFSPEIMSNLNGSTVMNSIDGNPNSILSNCVHNESLIIDNVITTLNYEGSQNFIYLYSSVSASLISAENPIDLSSMICHEENWNGEHDYAYNL